MKRFAHMSQAVFLILTLSLLLFIGTSMFRAPDMAAAFKSMNTTLLLPWLIRNSTDNPAIAIWIGLVVLTGILLFINTACCTWYTFVKRLRRRLPVPQLLIITIHVLVLVMLIGHGLNFAWGDKYPPFVLTEGQEQSFGDGYLLEAEKITLIADPEILTDKNKIFYRLTPEEFDTRANGVMLALYRNGQLLIRKEAHYMAPLEYESIKCLVTRFVINTQSRTPGVKILVIRNPSAEPMFIAYILMVLSTLGYTVLTWKKTNLQPVAE